MVSLGSKLGLYKAMAGAGPISAKELAARTGCAERYVSEWLNSQAAGGYVEESYHQDFYKKSPVRYQVYRWNCGRDQRLKEIWGDKATH